MKALFTQNTDPRCVYCARSKPLGPKEVACTKHGVVGAYDHCRSFRYDPLKRVPPRPAKLGLDYSEEDFKL